MKKFTLSTIFLAVLGFVAIKANANTAPVLTQVNPNQQTATITVVKGQSITFNVSGADADKNMTGIEWYNNNYIGGQSFSKTSSISLTRAISFNTVGNYIISCIAYDAVGAYGNTIAWSIKVVASNTAPMVTKTYPKNLATDTISIVKGQSITFSVSGTDADGNMAGIKWYNGYLIGGQTFANTGSMVMTQAISFNTAGNYTIAGIAYDANNMDGNTISWNVKVTEPKPVPTLTRLKPENQQTDTITIIKGQSVTFNVAGTDASGKMMGIEWYNNGDYSGSQTFALTGSATMTKNFVFNNVGIYSIVGMAFNNAYVYGIPITWAVKVVAPKNTLYVDNTSRLIGNTITEDTLINYALRNKITGFALYLSGDLMVNHHTEVNEFIGRAKAKGITEVSFIIGDGTYSLSAAMTYYNDPAVTNKFTGILTEIEYWNAGGGSGTPAYEAALADYLQVLTNMKNASNASGPGFKVECYMSGGWSQSEADRICKYADKILLVYYTSSINPQSVYYTYRRNQLQYFMNAAVNNNKNIEIKPLFDIGTEFNQADNSLPIIDNSFFGGFTTDNNLVNKYQKNLVSGSQYFTYTSRPVYFLYSIQSSLTATNYSTDTVFVKAGTTVNFVTQGNGITGADWYVNGTKNGTANGTSANNVQYNNAFNTAGIFSVQAITFNAGGLYTPIGFLKKKIVKVSPASSTNGRVALVVTNNLAQDTELLANINIKAYPNPVSSKLYVDLPQKASVQIYTEIGQQISAPILINGNRAEINVESLPTGSYFLQIRLQNAVKSIPFLKK